MADPFDAADTISIMCCFQSDIRPFCGVFISPEEHPTAEFARYLDLGILPTSPPNLESGSPGVVNNDIYDEPAIGHHRKRRINTQINKILNVMHTIILGRGMA